MRRAAAAVSLGRAAMVTQALCRMTRPDVVRGACGRHAKPNNMCVVPAPQRLAIAQVTPFAWEAANEVNDYVARVSDELAARGHRVLIVAPSESPSLVRDSRRAIRSDPESLLARADEEPA